MLGRLTLVVALLPCAVWAQASIEISQLKLPHVNLPHVDFDLPQLDKAPDLRRINPTLAPLPREISDGLSELGRQVADERNKITKPDTAGPPNSLKSVSAPPLLRGGGGPAKPAMNLPDYDPSGFKELLALSIAGAGTERLISCTATILDGR